MDKEYLYIFRLEGTDYYKVGVSKRVDDRRKSIQAHHPDRIILKVCERDCEERHDYYTARQQEKLLHVALVQYAWGHEWFLLPDDVVDLLVMEIMGSNEPPSAFGDFTKNQKACAGRSGTKPILKIPLLQDVQDFVRHLEVPGATHEESSLPSPPNDPFHG